MALCPHISKIYLLKKPNSDPSVHNNYRPISKLSFLSKVMEKDNQLSTYLHSFNILDQFQFVFQALHNTESALLKVMNDNFMTSNSGLCAVFILQYLSAAFNTIGHNILLNLLECEVGIHDSALNWFASYLKGRTSSDNTDKSSSSSESITCGVIQGFILGLFYSILPVYAPLGFFLSKTLIKSDKICSLCNLLTCINYIKCWIANNFLQLNQTKKKSLSLGLHFLTLS